MGYAIWKFDAPEPGTSKEIEMPIQAKIVKVGLGVKWVDPLSAYRRTETVPTSVGVFWAQVITEDGTALVKTSVKNSGKEYRRFTTIGTGKKYPPGISEYIGTWREGDEVWHLIETIRHVLVP